MSIALLRWQQLLGFSDDQAAQQVGLSVGEFRRQRVVGPSRQTALLAVLIVPQPNLATIAAAAANLDRIPTRPDHSDAVPDLCSDWS